ncbi:MAG TPA: erythromycin esterase family protein [Aquihabitans sp.]|jgi:erythromycin esterase-like protein|nr:erythromycin esterase family protein [Aquihabitans sp.]
MATDDLTTIQDLATPLVSSADLDPLVERARGARIVLIGEASHGTSEYYRWRAELTKRLLVEQSFDLVAVEGDWPDCFSINCWAKGAHPELDAEAALGAFRRWPTWMWANREVASFLGWLRERNADGANVGFYGLDVYSLWDSLRAVLDHVREHRPDALDAAREAVRCFEPYGEDPQRYARATRMVPTDCEEEVVDLLVDLQQAARTEPGGPEAELDAQQNAAVLAGAERYYRTMVRGDEQSWNVRDHHMADTLDRLLEHHGLTGRAVVWEHNTHIGDARATDMAAHGMVNVGQLARERHGDDEVFLVGFAGHRGSVIAGSSWGAPHRDVEVPPAPEGTHEDLLHRALGRDSLLLFGDDRTSTWLTERRGHRAIGVVYDPRRDRWGNWVPTVMGRRYDALIHLEETHALEPLDLAPPTGFERDTEPWAS